MTLFRSSHEGVSPSDKPTKYSSPVPIINTKTVPNETENKYPSHVPRNCQVTSQEKCQFNIQVETQQVLLAPFQLAIQVQIPVPIQAQTQIFSSQGVKRQKKLCK